MTRLKWTRPGFWGWFLIVLMVAGLAILYVRFTRGLGSVTNMSDSFPWGLWVGFDILCGVGLAAGGFTITSAVYLFNIKRWQPIVRPTVLTAFLGYLFAVIALLFDLGRPWNIWRPLVMWNPRSVMFEVAWCVMLYLTVLSLEVSGMVFERLGWKLAARVQHAVTVPLVLVGALLSTLHQSSLGSFYLIVPEKLYALWYTPMLPILFFLSAIAAGLAMVVVESRLSARALGHHLEAPLLSEIGRVLVGALAVYGTARIYDLTRRNAWPLVFQATPEAALFLLEFVGGLLIPLLLLTQRSVRESPKRLYVASLFVVLGFVTHRLNVSITGLERSQGVHYVPAVAELLVTVLLVAVGFAAFRLAVQWLPVFGHGNAVEPAPETAPSPVGNARLASQPAGAQM